MSQYQTWRNEMMKTHELKQDLPVAFALTGFFFLHPYSPGKLYLSEWGHCSLSCEKPHFTFQHMTDKTLAAKRKCIKRKPLCSRQKLGTLPLHGFSSVRQVHFNTVLPLVCLHANAIKHPSFPEFSIDCKTEANVTLIHPLEIVSVAFAKIETAALWIPLCSKSINAWVQHVKHLQ